MSQRGRLIAGIAALLLAPLSFLVFQAPPAEPQAHGCMDGLAFSGSGGFAFDITPYVVAGVLALVGIAFIISCAFARAEDGVGE